MIGGPCGGKVYDGEGCGMVRYMMGGLWGGKVYDGRAVGW